MTADLSNDDRGKTVVSGNERIGVVTDIRGERVYVDPDWDHVDDGLAETLGWDDVDDDAYYIEESRFAAARNDQVHLRDDLF